MAILLENLKSIDHFSGLDRAELEAIKGLMFEVKAGRGEFIQREAEPADALYFVVSGVVKVFKTSAEGKEQILLIVRPGESFNDVPVFGGGVNPCSAQSMGEVVLYGIRTRDMEAMLKTHPKLAMNVIRVLSQKLRHMVSLVEDLSFKHVTARVAKILLEYAGDGTGPKPKLTQQEMAAIAGTAREMIGRSLKDLEEEGMIKMDRHRIVITDKEALQRLAGMVS